MTTHSVDDILRPETRARLVELARELKRDPAELLDDAVREIDERARYRAVVEEGRRSAAEDGTTPWDEYRHELQRRRDEFVRVALVVPQ